MAREPRTPPLILASASPRRAELMREAGYTARIHPPPFGEPAIRGSRLSPAAWAEALSYYKARSVLDHVGEAVVLGGDTVVALGGDIFGKPRDRDDARRILRALRGTTHEVITGITLVAPAPHPRLIRHDRTRVSMRLISDREVEDYLDGGTWEGKAGAYGIQDEGDAFVTAIEGSFSNVVGFPMELVTRVLREFGVTPG